MGAFIFPKFWWKIKKDLYIMKYQSLPKGSQMVPQICANSPSLRVYLAPLWRCWYVIHKSLKDSHWLSQPLKTNGWNPIKIDASYRCFSFSKEVLVQDFWTINSIGCFIRDPYPYPGLYPGFRFQPTILGRKQWTQNIHLAFRVHHGVFSDDWYPTAVERVASMKVLYTPSIHVW